MDREARKIIVEQSIDFVYGKDARPLTPAQWTRLKQVLREHFSPPDVLVATDIEGRPLIRAVPPAPPAGGYDQALMKPELVHRVRHNPLQGTWDVLGPDGSYKAYHHQDEAEAVAAFWSGDMLHAEEYRRRALHRRGLIKKEEV